MKIFCFAMVLCALSLPAGDLEMTGVNALRQADPALNGHGIAVAHVEPSLTTNTPPQFEANPALNPKPDLFAYTSALGMATNFPNAVGEESWHANDVGARFYGIASGVATNVARVDNYDADYFYNNIIAPLIPPTPGIAAAIVNQSFIFDSVFAENVVNPKYDDYAASHGTLFVSGIGNGGSVYPPASCFNGIGVGAYNGATSIGPTSDGRSKPDIVAPEGATSFSTPYVSGGAAILLQAANRGDGGTNLSAASDVRTLKSLLLNGAVKPSDWTNTLTKPLDARYGAGILNVFNSWNQLRGGRHAFIESTANNNGSPHPPGSNTNDVPSLVGWDFNTIATTSGGIPPALQQRVNHYYFNVPTNSGAFTFTATLVWNKQNGQSAINDLNLFLYDTATGTLLSASTSAVDNVEHMFLTSLPPGRYDLQVEKNPDGLVSLSETYALAFEMFSMNLTVASSNSNVLISWPASPSGFVLETAATLTPPLAWSPVSAPVSISDHRNIVSIPATGPSQLFRLRRP